LNGQKSRTKVCPKYRLFNFEQSQDMDMDYEQQERVKWQFLDMDVGAA
jgi:hypothetical protein